MTIEKFIADIKREVSPLENVALKKETRIREVEAWDSLANLMLLSMIDLDWGIQLNPRELWQCDTIQDIFNQLQLKTSGNN